MILATSLYQDVKDALLDEANGEYSFSLHNRYSPLAELKLMDFITGDIKGKLPPEPYTTQKVKDWAAPFIVSYKTHISNGIITRPADYYGYENMSIIGSILNQQECDSDEQPADNGNTPIALLSGEQFDSRCQTYIDELKPSFKQPIAKAVGKNFHFFPRDLGSINLEYYRYPKFAQIKTTIDAQFNEEVPDQAATTNYEWDEKAKGLLIWFIVDMYANRTSNQSQKQFNAATGKTAQES